MFKVSVIKKIVKTDPVVLSNPSLAKLLNQLKTSCIDKKQSPAWSFSDTTTRSPTKFYGFVFDIDNLTLDEVDAKVSKKYHFFLHKTHNDNLRLIIPFDHMFVMNTEQFKKAYTQCNLDFKFKPKQADPKDDDIDWKCCDAHRFNWMRPIRHKLLEIRGETYTPVFVTKIIEAITRTNYTPREIEWPEEAEAMLKRVNAFYNYYKTKINWSKIATNQCQLGLHDNNLKKDIHFNKPSEKNGFAANIHCYHTTCVNRLKEELALLNTTSIINYTVLYLFYLIRIGKLHIHQLEECGISPLLHPYLPRLNLLQWQAKLDAPLWLKFLHEEAVKKNGVFYEYKKGIYVKMTKDDLYNMYEYHAGTYVAYRLESIGKKIKTKTFTEDTIAYICAETHHNYNHITEEDGLALDNKVIFFNNNILTVADHSPNYFFTVKASYNYDEKAQCPLWLKTLTDYFDDPNAPQIQILQEFFGYVLTYDDRFQKFLVLFGVSEGGKNTITEILMALVNGISADFNLLINPKERQFIVGQKLLFINESFNCEKQTHVNQLKKLVSTEPLEVRPLYSPTFQLIDKPKLIVSFNKPPESLKIDQAMRNRMLTLKFTKTFLGKANIHLKDQLRKELSGILNWAIDGNKRLYKNGHFTFYDDATKELYDEANETDIELIDFLNELPRANYLPTELLDKYCEYTGDWKNNNCITFGKKMRALGIEKKSIRVEDVSRKHYILK